MKKQIQVIILFRPPNHNIIKNINGVTTEIKRKRKKKGGTLERSIHSAIKAINNTKKAIAEKVTLTNKAAYSSHNQRRA